MKNYILIDIYNIFFRAMYTNNESNENMEGMLLHTLITMIKKSCDKFQPDHLVVCADGKGTWRKQIYPQYKANRVDKLQEKKPSEIEREEKLKKLFTEDFLPFLSEHTNISVLQYPLAEADDIIARFCALHPNDNKIILSTDNDFVQLLNDSTIIYNSMDDRIITNKGIVSSLNNKPIKFTLKNGKVSVSRKDPLCGKGDPLVPFDKWVEYALFTKCIRGDSSDNIFSAYPKITEKSTTKRIGMMEAFEGMADKNYAWNTFMNQTWDDLIGQKKLVKDCYEFNRKIIDLEYIPEDLKLSIDTYITENVNREDRGQVSFKVAKYFNKHNLVRLQESINSFSKYFTSLY